MSYPDTNAEQHQRPPAYLGGLDVRTLTGAVTLLATGGMFHAFDPGGASRDVTMWTPTIADQGRPEQFYNAADAAEDLVIKQPGGTTIVTLGQAQWATVVAGTDGTWTLVARGQAAVSAATDTISESTGGVGVTIDGLRIQDATIKPAAGGSAFIDLTAAATGEADVILADNLASAFEVREAANVYLKFVTTDGSEAVNLAKPITMTSGMASILDLSAASTGNADVILGDNLADAFTIREAATAYATVTTTNDAERVRILKILAEGPPTGTIAAPIDMAGAEHTLVLGTAAAAQTKLLGNTVFVDANTGSAPENLVLPSAASLTGVTLRIINVGGEQVTVNTSVLTLETTEGGFVTSDGTSWYGFGVGGAT